MPKIELKYCELHNPLFLGGTNLQCKLDPGRRAGLQLFYDGAEKELYVHFQGEIGVIPSSNIACMQHGSPVVRASPITHPIVAGLQGAQVETPMSHVHAGHGHGKTGIGGRVKE